MIKRALLSVLFLVVFSFSLAGCADNKAEPAAMTGESHSAQSDAWFQP
ncbi:MAG: hypothetical protein JXQ73_20245 [Phycisphaerae bacterium]|nr:hypothetical protein [Phycisphaerae bacterium]